MSEKALKKAARIKDSRFDLGHHITIMLMADRADDDGRFSIPAEDHDKFMSNMVAETNAVMARLRGDELVRPGVDNARVTRVVEALKDAQDEA